MVSTLFFVFLYVRKDRDVLPTSLRGGLAGVKFTSGWAVILVATVGSSPEPMLSSISRCTSSAFRECVTGRPRTATPGYSWVSASVGGSIRSPGVVLPSPHPRLPRHRGGVLASGGGGTSPGLLPGERWRGRGAPDTRLPPHLGACLNTSRVGPASFVVNQAIRAERQRALYQDEPQACQRGPRPYAEKPV